MAFLSRLQVRPALLLPRARVEKQGPRLLGSRKAPVGTLMGLFLGSRNPRYRVTPVFALLCLQATQHSEAEIYAGAGGHIPPLSFPASHPVSFTCCFLVCRGVHTCPCRPEHPASIPAGGTSRGGRDNGAEGHPGPCAAALLHVALLHVAVGLGSSPRSLSPGSSSLMACLAPEVQSRGHQQQR